MIKGPAAWNRMYLPQVREHRAAGLEGAPGLGSVPFCREPSEWKLWLLFSSLRSSRMRGLPPRGLAPLPFCSRPRDLSAPPPALQRSSSWGVHRWHPLEDTKGSVTHSHPALLPSPDLLNGHHYLLDVILGLAPGLGPQGPAGHTAYSPYLLTNSSQLLATTILLSVFMSLTILRPSCI